MPATETAGLAIALLRASDWFNAALLARLVQQGWPALNRSQSLTFANLDPEGTRPAELARRVGMSRQSMQKLVADLAGHGLVAVIPDPEDGRATVVQLTRDGRRLVAAAAATLVELESELATRIGSSAVRSLRTALMRDWGPPPLDSRRPDTP